eukprot:GFUD01039497.1.p1 GENE.GFUD01039497.1~~GFUD01039497.1.p1  ORF type:complete len:517 (+),score=164.23 GFUD01039497.1:39-1589(+)
MSSSAEDEDSNSESSDEISNDVEDTTNLPLEDSTKLPPEDSTELPPEETTNTPQVRSSLPPPTFSSLGVCSWLLSQLSCLGISSPTPVQSACIPSILSGRDCVGVAKTGEGKTLAFALPILQTLSVDPYGVYALVLTPTRELANQIGDTFRSVGKPMGLRDVVVTGGRDTIRQSQDLDRRPHVVIATPGRLADHIENNSTFSLSKVKYLVLDEADRLLEGGFDGQLATILSALPSSRQTLLFTATTSPSVTSVVNSCKNNPLTWISPTLSTSSTVATLDQRYLLTPPEAQDAYLVQLLLDKKAKNPRHASIVFCRTCRTAELVGILLAKVGVPTSTLHSMRPQKERVASLARFKSGHTKVLVATDVASRGLDIPEVNLVVNHNIPRNPVDYVHRVGRTARAGRGGLAVSLVTPTDVGLVQSIETHTGVKWEELEGDDSKVAEILVQVNTVRREGEIELGERDWGEQREINKRKRKIQEGIDPDLEEKSQKKLKKKMLKKAKKERLKSKQIIEAQFD